jgi:hypothetical protein
VPYIASRIERVVMFGSIAAAAAAIGRWHGVGEPEMLAHGVGRERLHPEPG